MIYINILHCGGVSLCEGYRVQYSSTAHCRDADGAFKQVIEGEVVEEQEGIVQVTYPQTERTQQSHASAFHCDLWIDGLGDSPGHGWIDDVEVYRLR